MHTIGLFYSQDLKIRNHFKDLNVDGKVMLKWVLNKQNKQ